MQTDEERREVAQELRELRHTTYYREEAVENICDVIGIADPVNTFREPEDVYKLLADLIDRPTCHDTSDNDYEFKCSNCSAYTLKPGNYYSEVGYVRGSGEHLRYCPNCGAEVVE